MGIHRLLFTKMYDLDPFWLRKMGFYDPMMAS